jgi:hypothetical protein
VKRKALWIALALAPLAAVAATSASAADIDCKMTFTLSGWSAIYETASGTGVVTCENGQTMDVAISAKGGGLTVGKYKIDDGKGTFSDVSDISQVLGSYAQASAHAGAVGSVRAAVMTKGPVSLALAGTGEGVDIGIDVGEFTLSREK